MIPFDVQRIDHVVLRVTDLDRSIAFFGALLGCQVVQRREELGLVHLRAGASMIDLISVDGFLGRKGGLPPGAEGRNMDHVCLRIHPFDPRSILAFLNEAGVTPTQTAQANFGAEGIGPAIYFRDPDGNEIELKGPSTDAA
jgi:catechol 2,3-dioxygenase-like lactoylglutathione lyase family enzyme